MPEPSNPPAAPGGVQLCGVTLQRGAATVLHRLDLHLSEPRIGLIGDNGAGKSSLLRLLAGLDEPTAGQVRLDGQVAPAGPGGRGIGLMFQNPDEQIIFPTVEEELALGLERPGRPRREARALARRWLADRGLAGWADRAIGSLSQGQRQWVCWLALLITAPRRLLLDEPFASLDLPGQARLQREIQALPQQVIVATHLLAPVRGFERVLWLAGGRVRADGAGEAVCAAYEADVAARLMAEGDRRVAEGDRPLPAAA